MKKFLIVIFISGLFGVCKAQDAMVTVGLGYNMMFTGAKALNVVIDRYNETRPFLSKEMGHVYFMDGISFNSSATIGVIMFDFNYNKKVSVVSAQGDNGYGLMQRDLKIKNGNIGIGLGVHVFEMNPAVAVGFSADIGMLTFKTRSASPDEIRKYDFEEFEYSLTSGMSIWFQLLFASNDEGLALSLRPYYHFDFLKYNYEWFNQGINPDTYYYDRYDQHGKINHFGIQLILNYYKKV
jgi:hypothetical protein